jgi:histidine phosphotransferase ChpT
MSDPFRLAELLCARICHDLSGPVGSLMGVIELALEESASESEALAVAAQAATVLRARLELLRAAWAGELGTLALGEIKRLAKGIPNGTRTTLDTTGLSAAVVFPAAQGQLILNALLLAGESLPGGGSIAISGDPDQDIVVTIAGPRAAWPAALAACLTNEDAAWAALTSARTVQGPMMALIARKLGVDVSLLMPIGQNGGAAPLLLRVGPEG